MSPSSCQVALVAGDDGGTSPALGVGQFLSIFHAGQQVFRGKIQRIEGDLDTTRGRVFTVVLVDSRADLQHSRVYGAWNLENPDWHGTNAALAGNVGATLDRDRNKRFMHILPGDSAAGVKTYSAKPKTAAQVLDSAFGGAEGVSLPRGYVSALNQPMGAVDARDGISLANLVSRIAGETNVEVTLTAAGSLQFFRRGAFGGSIPPLSLAGVPVASRKSLGVEASSQPTQCTVVGGPYLIQVGGVTLEPDWTRAYEQFWSELAWQRKVGEVFGLNPKTPAEFAERAARSMEVTVGEFAARAGGNFADHGRFGDVSRMQLPVHVYLQEIVFRAYRVPIGRTFLGLERSSLRIHEGLLMGVELSSPSSGAMKLDASQLYPRDRAFCVVRGMPLDFADSTSAQFNLAHSRTDFSQQWSVVEAEVDRQNLSFRFRTSVFEVGSGEQGLFRFPNRGRAGGNKEFEEIILPNPGAVIRPASAKAAFTLEVGRFTERVGSGPRRTSIAAQDLSPHLVDTTGFAGGAGGMTDPISTPFAGGSFSEIPYADGSSARKLARQMANAAISGGGAEMSGQYTRHGTFGAETGELIDRVELSIDPVNGVTETVHFTRGGGARGGLSPRVYDRLARTEEMFPNQAQHQLEIRRLRVMAEAIGTGGGGAQARVIRPFDLGKTVVGNSGAGVTMFADTGDGAMPRSGGAIIWLDNAGKPSASGERFGGVVTADFTGDAVYAATNGIVPVMVKGPFSPNQVVSCDPGESSASVDPKKKIPLGRVLCSSTFDKEGETILAHVQLGAIPGKNIRWEIIPTFNEEGKFANEVIVQEGTLYAPNISGFHQPVGGIAFPAKVPCQVGQRIFLKLRWKATAGREFTPKLAGGAGDAVDEKAYGVHWGLIGEPELVAQDIADGIDLPDAAGPAFNEEGGIVGFLEIGQIIDGAEPGSIQVHQLLSSDTYASPASWYLIRPDTEEKEPGAVEPPDLPALGGEGNQEAVDDFNREVDAAKEELKKYSLGILISNRKTAATFVSEYYFEKVPSVDCVILRMRGKEIIEYPVTLYYGGVPANRKRTCSWVSIGTVLIDIPESKATTKLMLCKPVPAVPANPPTQSYYRYCKPGNSTITPVDEGAFVPDASGGLHTFTSPTEGPPAASVGLMNDYAFNTQRQELYRKTSDTAYSGTPILVGKRVSVLGSSTLNWSITPSDQILGGEIKISSTADNGLSITGTGLHAASHRKLTIEETSTVSLVLGTGDNDQRLGATLRVSSASPSGANAIQTLGDGIYVPPATSHNPATATGTSSLSLSVSGEQVITGNVVLSGTSTQGLQILSDGLFARKIDSTADVPENPSYLYYTDGRVSTHSTIVSLVADQHPALTITDTSSIDLTVASGQVLSAAARVDSAGGLTVSGDGLKMLADPAGDNALTLSGAGAHVKKLTVADTSTMDLTLSAGNELSAVLKVSATGGNAVQVNADGLYIPTNTQAHDAVTVTDTSTIDLTLTGQALSAILKVDSAGDNALSVSGSGLYAKKLTVADTSAIDLTLNAGTNELSALVNLDPASDNAVSLTATGLYAKKLTIADTSTLDVTLTAGNQLSAEVKVSATGGNAIQINADGIYIPSNTQAHDAVTVTDTSTIDLTLSTQALSAAVKLDADSTNAIGVTANGLYSRKVIIADTSTLDLTLNAGTNEISGAVKLDGASDNELSATANGLYSKKLTVTDTSSLDLTLSPTTNELSATVKLDGASDNWISVTASGLYSKKLTVADTSSFDITLNPTTHELSGAVKLDGASDNAVSITANGLYSKKLTVADTSTLDVTLNPTTHELSGEIKVSATGGNAIQVNADGLYIPSNTQAHDAVTVTDTSTIDFTISGAQVLTGVVKISADSGNALQIHGDGIFIPSNTQAHDAVTVTDTSTIDFTISGAQVLTGSVKIDASDSTNALSATANGLYTRKLTALDTSGIDLTLNGSQELTANVRLDGASDNAIGLTAGGLYTKKLTVLDTSSFDATLNPTTNELSGAVKLDGASDNAIGLTASGLYTKKLTVAETSTITPTLNPTTQQLSSSIRVSGDSGNALQIRADGIFIPSNTQAHDAVTVTDTSTIDFTINAGQVLTGAVKVDSATDNAVTVTGSGLYTRKLTVIDSSTITPTLNPSTNQFSAVVRLSGDTGNALQIRSDGMFIPSNTQAHDAVTVTDTSTIDFTISGAQVLTGSVKLDAASDNEISATASGLYSKKLTVLDTSGLDLTLNPTTNELSGAVRVSADSGNGLELRSNGLFLPSNTPITVTDTSTIDLTFTGTNLSGVVITDPASDNAVTITTNGLYSKKLTVLDTSGLDLTLNPTTNELSGAPKIDLTDGTNAISLNGNGLYSRKLTVIDTSGIDLGLNASQELTATVRLDAASDNWLTITANGLYSKKLTVLDTSTVDVTLNPTTNELSGSVKLDAAGDNEITITANGLYSKKLTVLDTSTVDVTLNPTTNELSGSVKLDAAGDNELTITANGLYSKKLTVLDTSTVDVTLNPTTNELSGAVRVSTDSGNAIELRSTGLFIPSNTQAHDPVTVLDTATVDFTLTGQEVSGSVKLDPASDNAISATANGLYQKRLTIADTSTLDLTLSAGEQLSGAVKLDAATDNVISATANGLYTKRLAPLNTSSITATLNPTTQELTTHVKVSTDSGNAIELRSTGLFIPSNTQAHDPVTVLDTATVDFALTGQQVSGSVKLDADGTNAISATANGLYARKVIVADSSTVDLTLNSGTNEVSGSVKVSADSGNTLEIRANGLFSTPVTVTDTSTIDFTLTGQAITGSVKVDPVGTNGLAINADGLWAKRIDSTADVPEHATRLYYTDVRADTRIVNHPTVTGLVADKHKPVSVTGGSGLNLSVNNTGTNQAVTGSVKLDTSPTQGLTFDSVTSGLFYRRINDTDDLPQGASLSRRYYSDSAVSAYLPTDPNIANLTVLSHRKLTVAGTSALSLSLGEGVNDQALTGGIVVSPNSNNAISVQSNGLYVTNTFLPPRPGTQGTYALQVNSTGTSAVWVSI